MKKFLKKFVHWFYWNGIHKDATPVMAYKAGLLKALEIVEAGSITNAALVYKADQIKQLIEELPK